MRTNGKLRHNNGNKRTQDTLGGISATETHRGRGNGEVATSFWSDKIRGNRGNITIGNQYGVKFTKR